MLLTNIAMRSGVEANAVEGRKCDKPSGTPQRGNANAPIRKSTLKSRKAAFCNLSEGYRAYVISNLSRRGAKVRMRARSQWSGAKSTLHGRKKAAHPRFCKWICAIGDVREELDIPVRAFRSSDIGGVLGALYVLEGSSLGAKWVARRAAALGVDHHHGAFHLGHQIADPNAFGNFLHLLETTHLDADNERGCLRTGPIDTFECFKHFYDSDIMSEMKCPRIEPVNLTNCDREPIHIPGSIQRHGAMMVCHPESYRLLFASRNMMAVVGFTGELRRSMAPFTKSSDIKRLMTFATLPPRPEAPGLAGHCPWSEISPAVAGGFRRSRSTPTKIEHSSRSSQVCG